MSFVTKNSTYLTEFLRNHRLKIKEETLLKMNLSPPPKINGAPKQKNNNNNK